MTPAVGFHFGTPGKLWLSVPTSFSNFWSCGLPCDLNSLLCVRRAIFLNLLNFTVAVKTAVTTSKLSLSEKKLSVVFIFKRQRDQDLLNFLLNIKQSFFFLIYGINLYPTPKSSWLTVGTQLYCSMDEWMKKTFPVPHK